MNLTDSPDPAPRPRVRTLLAQRLSTAEEFDAFCLDYFPAVKSRFAGGMDRLARENLLLEMQTPEDVIAALMRHAGQWSQTRRKLARWGWVALVPPLVGVVVWHVPNPLLSPQSAVTVNMPYKVTPLTSDANLTGAKSDDPMEFAARAQRLQSSARIEAKVRVSTGGREKEVTVILVDEKTSKPISFTHYVSPIALAWTNSLNSNARVLFQVIDRQIQRDSSSFLEKVRSDQATGGLQDPETKGAEERPDELPPAIKPKNEEFPDQHSNLSGRASLFINTSPEVHFRIDRGPYQAATKTAISIAAGRHLISSISGIQEFQIKANATVTIQIAASQAEQLVQSGRGSFDKSDYTKAKKQLEKAISLCVRDHKQVQACSGLLLEASILLGKIYESQQDLADAMNAFQNVAKYAVNVRGKNEQKAYAQAAIARLRPHLGQVIVTQKSQRGCKQEVNWLHPGTTYVRLNGSVQSVAVKAGGVTNIGSCQ